MDLSYPAVRDRLTQWGLWPRSRVARGAWYALGLALFLFLLQQLFAVLRLSWGQGLGGWVSFLSFIAILFFSILAFRWLKNKILWRLRNRLIVTYVFIGVIPTLLLFAMAFATLYLFAGQFANFIVTSEIHLQLQNVEAVNAAIANELSVRLQRGEPPTVALVESPRKTEVIWKHRDVCAWYGAKPLPICGDGKGNTPFTQPSFVYAPFSEIVRDHGNLYLRTANLLTVRSDKLLVVSSEALDQELVQEIANNLGEITLYGTGLALQEPSRIEGDSAGNTGKATKSAAEPKSAPTGQGTETPRATFTAGTAAEGASTLEHLITFGTPLPVTNWETGDRERNSPLVKVQTRPSVLFILLFAVLGDFAMVVVVFF